MPPRANEELWRSFLVIVVAATHIQDLFEEWDEPIPISIDYLEDEIELKATIL